MRLFQYGTVRKRQNSETVHLFPYANRTFHFEFFPPNSWMILLECSRWCSYKWILCHNIMPSHAVLPVKWYPLPSVVTPIILSWFNLTTFFMSKIVWRCLFVNHRKIFNAVEWLLKGNLENDFHECSGMAEMLECWCGVKTSPDFVRPCK